MKCLFCVVRFVRIFGLSLVVLLFPFAADQLCAQTTITVGETNVLTGNSSGNGNVLTAQRETLPQTATIQSLSFYVLQASGNLRLGIYDATGPGGDPGALKAQTNSFAAVSGWNTANVVTPVTLQPGTYWLAFLPSSSSLHFAADFGIESYRFNFAAMPGTYSTTPTNGPTHWSFYATLTPTSGNTVNGQCGPSNGVGASSAPATNLCNAGTASTVGGTGPWNWTCTGANGGTNASCSAPLLVTGQCGAANGVGVTKAPTTNLCSAGTASTVGGTGPWNWSCTGANGGGNASCSAPSEVSGVCGSANGSTLTNAPTTNLCSAGSASTVSGTGPWNWSCSGSNGGANASCSAQPQSGTSTITMGETKTLSGVDSGNGGLLIAQQATLSQTATVQSISLYVVQASGNLELGIYDATGPSGGPGALKATTNSFTPVTGWNTASVITPVNLPAGTYWLAYLPSSNSLEFGSDFSTGTYEYSALNYGPMPAKYSTSTKGGTSHWSLYATLVGAPSNGSCGSANGVAAGSAPSTNLCSAGTASTVAGTGPWTWSCSGIAGGTTASCSAPAAPASGVCGSSNGASYSSTPTTNLCSVGAASSVSGTGPWTWSCSGLDGGATASCSAELTSPGSTQLVQHVSSSSSRNNSFSSPYCYNYQLPNPTTPGNAVLVGYTNSNNVQASVVDDMGDTYKVLGSTHDSANNQSVGIAAAFNVNAGARTISVCFNSDPGYWVQPMATEFTNLVAADGAGVGGTGTGASVAAGSLTPTQSGDVVYQVTTSLSHNQTSFAAGPQMTLLSADLMDGWAGQYSVDSGTTAINPTMTMGSSQKWITEAVLLKAGTTGYVPSGLRVVHLIHENVPYNEPAGGSGSPFPNPLALQVPSSGNLVVAMLGGGNGPEQVTGISDNKSNVWQRAGSNYANGDATVQTYYAANPTTSSDLRLSVSWNGTQGDYTFFLYDVAGAATASPLDTVMGAGGNQSTPGNLTMPYTLTPATSNEIVFSEVMWDWNTATGLQGQLFDTNTFSGESLSGPEPVDENNGWGHTITSNTNPISFTWTTLPINLAVADWVGMAAAFKGAN